MAMNPHTRYCASLKADTSNSIHTQHSMMHNITQGCATHGWHCNTSQFKTVNAAQALEPTPHTHTRCTEGTTAPRKSKASKVTANHGQRNHLLLFVQKKLPVGRHHKDTCCEQSLFQQTVTLSSNKHQHQTML
jgi:hypothetical protein